MTLKEHVALIPGATGAVGKAVTQAFLFHGATVVAPFLSAGSFQELASRVGEAGERPLGIQTDLLKPQSIQYAVGEALNKTGRIDSLVNLVGGFVGGQPVAQTDDEIWNQMLALNLTSAFLVTRAVLPHMLERGRGSIVHISSRAAVEPFPAASAYIASKAGLIAFTRALASEVAGTGVTANVIVPGTLDTPANRRNMPRADFSKWVPPEALAHAILFLVSEGAQQINGAQVPVYGAA